MVAETIYRYDDIFIGLTHIRFIFLILIYFQLIMSGVNYAINGCFSSITTPVA